MNYIRLNACDLDSKFGFEDGDILENHGFDVDHDVLIKLVKRYLFPAIGRDVKTARWSTSHNPIRLVEDEELTDEERDVFFDVSYEQIQEVIGLPDKITSCNAEYIRVDLVEKLIKTSFENGTYQQHFESDHRVVFHPIADVETAYKYAGLGELK